MAVSNGEMSLHHVDRDCLREALRKLQEEQHKRGMDIAALCTRMGNVEVSIGDANYNSKFQEEQHLRGIDGAALLTRMTDIERSHGEVASTTGLLRGELTDRGVDNAALLERVAGLE